MSALADSRARTGSRPPGYGPLLLATLSAQIFTGLALWVVQFPFALLGVAPSSVADSLWLPWGIDGAWSALGIAAYVLIVCVLGGAMVSSRVADRGVARPAPAWAWLAFGAAGYAAIALGHSGGMRLLLAVVLAPLTLRLFAYRLDGGRRPWPSRLSLGRRGLAAALAVAVLVALSYSGTHAFTQNGSAGSASPAARSGHTVVLNVGVHGIALPSQITAVDLDGRGAATLRVLRTALTSEQDAPAATVGRPVTGPVARSLPVRLGAQANGWLAVRFSLRTCPKRSPWIDAITLHYRVLGVATSERIPLWRAVQLVCRRPAGSSLSD
jgi:hypothetical protein